MMEHIDEIIIRKEPKNWILTIQITTGGKEPLDFKFPAEKNYDHVIYCTAGNGMYKPFGKPAWQTLAKNIKSLGKEEHRKVNVILVGSDEIWRRKLEAHPENIFYRNKETSGLELHSV